MVIGVDKIELYIDGNRSLKGKRHIIKSLIERVKSRFGNLSVAEVDSNDLWRKATLGITVVSNDAPVVDSVMNRVFNFIEAVGTVQVIAREHEIIHF